jgi:superfamily II DNA/RNA helicase
LGVLNNVEDNDDCQCIIITPTRDLSRQVFTVATKIAKYTNINIVLATGGTEIKSRELKKSNVVIGTIGRIKHMIVKKNIEMDNLKMLVLDEVDELLEDNLSEDLTYIFNEIPQTTQKCFISATITRQVFETSKKLLNNPEKILLKKEEIAVDLIKQFYVDISMEQLKIEVLLDLYSLINTSQAIIFCNTIRKVEWISEKLIEENFTITSVHGKMNSKERENIIKDFRDGKTRILITTDLLARGIDIDQINLVINYDLPPNKQTYIHRIGRCGRFGKRGVAISFVKGEDDNDNNILDRMKKYYKIEINELTDNVEELLNS